MLPLPQTQHFCKHTQAPCEWVEGIERAGDEGVGEVGGEEEAERFSHQLKGRSFFFSLGPNVAMEREGERERVTTRL